MEMKIRIAECANGGFNLFGNFSEGGGFMAHGNTLQELKEKSISALRGFTIAELFKAAQKELDIRKVIDESKKRIDELRTKEFELSDLA